VDEKAVVLWVGGLGQRHGLTRSVRDEQFLAGNANTLPAASLTDFRCVFLEPAQVAIEPSLTSRRVGQFSFVRDFFQRWRPNGIDHRPFLPKEKYLFPILHRPRHFSI
jgi:hypothetical protein